MPPQRPRLVIILIQIANVAIFLILASLIILGAHGYRFNTVTQTFQQTGLIGITVEPEEVTVEFEGTKESDKSPVKLSYLLPGFHTVKLHKDGYHSWVKTTHVASGEAEVFPFVVLFLADGETQPATQSQMAELESRQLATPDPDYDLRGSEIWVKPFSRTYPFAVAGPDYALISRFSRPVAKATWLPGKTHLLFQLEEEIHIMDRDGSNDLVIVTLSSAEPTDFYVTSDGRTLVYRDGSTVWRKQIQ